MPLHEQNTANLAHEAHKQNTTNLECETPKAKPAFLKVLSFIGLVFIIAFTTGVFRACNTSRLQKEQIERASIVTTIWVPHPRGGMIPYNQVEVLQSSPGFIKFRTLSGEVIQHSGQYQVRTEARP